MKGCLQSDADILIEFGGGGHCVLSLVCQILHEVYVTVSDLLVNVRVVVLWDVTPCGLEDLASCIVGQTTANLLHAYGVL